MEGRYILRIYFFNQSSFFGILLLHCVTLEQNKIESIAVPIF